MIISLVSGLLQDIHSRLREIERRKTAASATADVHGDEIFNEHTAEDIIELNKELEKSPAKWVEFVTI